MADDLTAAQLVARRLCSAQCLTSTGTEAQHCGCPCRGRWHGLLARVPIPGSADVRPAPPEPHEGQGDLLAGLGDGERKTLGLPVERADAE